MDRRCFLYENRPSKIISTVGEPSLLDYPVERRVSIKGTCKDTEGWYKDQDWFEAGNRECTLFDSLTFACLIE